MSSPVSPRFGFAADYRESERNRLASLERTLRVVRYLETSGRWVCMKDLERLGLGVTRKTLWRYMQVIERVYGLDVRGGECLGSRPIPEAVQWRFRK